ncbi:DUF7882 family protein [Microbacterium xylanilyticum]
MGVIYYGGAETPIHIEDGVLAHLKIVIATKLRRNESFTLSFQHGEGEPRGRTTIWLHPSIPLRFVFDEPVGPELDATLIRDLAASANTSGGIALKPEHVLRGKTSTQRSSGDSDSSSGGTSAGS